MNTKTKGIIGMIVPPPDMRAIIDKTAKFIAKQGPAMEKKIYSTDTTGIKFAFILPEDPFHAYYKMAVASFKEGKTPEIPKPKEEMPQQPEETEEEKEKERNVAAASLSTVEKKARFNPLAAVYRDVSDEIPPEYQFSSNLPELYALDLDIIKLTAQYTAVNGRKFLEGIMNYQSHNSQFDFLKPTHILNGFFTSLVEQYSHIIHFESDMKDPLFNKYKNSLNYNLKLCVRRVDYRHQEEERKRLQQAKSNSDQLSFQTVDWFDFAVVETITFDEDTKSIPNAEHLIEPEQMEVDMETEDVPVVAQVLKQESVSGTPDMKIVDNYQPRLKTSTPGQVSMVDPLTKRAIPMDQANEHLRIELIDPKWKEQKEVRKQRDTTTNLVSGDEMTDTMRRMRLNKDADDTGVKRVKIEPVNNGSEMDDAAIDAQIRQQRLKAMGTSVPVVQQTASVPLPPPMTVELPTANVPRLSMPIMPPMGMPGMPMMPRPMMPPMGMPMMPPMGMPPMMPRPMMPPMGMPPMGMPLPMMPPMGMPPVSGASPMLMPEQQWVASHPGPVAVIVQLPTDSSTPAWNLTGQSITVSMDINASVKALKQKICEMQGGMPENKQQLKHAVHGFLKDNLSLGYYNLSSGMELQLTVRSRGGRK